MHLFYTIILFAMASVISAAVPVQTVEIQPGETNIVEKNEKTWTFPAVKTPRRIYLELWMRINHRAFYGLNATGDIELNGIRVGSMMNRARPRLLNKPFTFRCNKTNYLERTWYRNGHWTVPYAPDYDSTGKFFRPELPEAHRYVFDVSDLVRDDAENNLQIRFAASIRYHFRHEPFIPDLMVKDIRLILDPEKDKDCVLASSPKPPYIQMDLSARKPVPVQLKHGADGTLQISSKQQTVMLHSSYSLPGGQWFRPDLQTGSVTIHPESNVMNMHAENFRVERTFQAAGEGFLVREKITNTTQEPLGIKLKYWFDMTRPPLSPELEVRLAGDPDPSVSLKKSGRNPSVYLAVPGNGVALLPADDVFQVHSEQFYHGNQAGLQDNYLLIAPGATHEVKFKIYAGHADYWSFINACRRDMKVNFPIEGGFSFSMNRYCNIQPDQAKEFIRNRSVKLLAATIWTTYWYTNGKVKDSVHHGDAIFDPENAKLRDAAHLMLKNAKQFSPGVDRFLYFHKAIYSAPRGKERFSSDRVEWLNGTPVLFAGSPFCPVFLPTVDNAYGKNVLKTVEKIIREFDCEGIYIDEFTHSESLIAYHKSDGVSVLMDPNTHKIIRPIGFVSLMTKKFDRNLVETIVGKYHKKLILNHAPNTTDLNDFKIIRFEESWDSSWAYWTHLYTPVSLGDMWSFSPREMHRDILERLRRGTLYYWYDFALPYPTVTEHMFPFTPVELHSGWLWGKERIITMHSGEYGFPGEHQALTAYVYDRTGRKVDHHPFQWIDTEYGSKLVIQLPPQWSAVIVRESAPNNH